jgi:hypothetical protein
LTLLHTRQVRIARHARSCERHGGSASSTRIEAPSQSAQDPHHLGWTPLSILTSLGAKRTSHVFDHFYRRHMPEVPQTSKALRHLAIHNYHCADCGPYELKSNRGKQAERTRGLKAPKSARQLVPLPGPPASGAVTLLCFALAGCATATQQRHERMHTALTPYIGRCARPRTAGQHRRPRP